MANQNINNYVATLSEIESKALKTVLNRRANHEAEEYRMEVEMNRKKELDEWRKYRLMEEEKYAAEMNERNRLRVIDAKRRQQVRESNQELRELESKLRAAYVGKSIKLQLAEKEAKRMEEMLNIKKDQQLLAELRLAEERAMEERKRKDKLNQIKLRNELTQQIETKSSQKQMMYKEFLQEKQKVDEIVRQIQEERMAELYDEFWKKNNLRKGLEELQRMKQVWKEREQMEIEEENRRIIKYLEEQEIRNEKAKVITNEKMKKTFALAEKMCAELEEIEKQTQQRNELQIALKIEELNEKAELKERENLERNVRQRIRMRLTLEQQRQDNLNLMAKAKEDENEFRSNQLRLLAERDKVYQMTADKRRRVIADHHRSVRVIIEQNKIESEKERLKLVQENIYNMEQHKELLKIIEEERLKILKEHAAELIGYFPPGILRESDRAHLNM